MKATLGFGIVTLLALSFCSLIKSESPAEGESKKQSGLPRYKLEVGQELVYASTSDSKGPNGGHEFNVSTTLWVTRKNEDGSWHVVGHSEREFTQHFTGKFNIPTHTDTQRTLGEFDVRPDGTVVIDPQDSRSRYLTGAFFKLPANAEELESGWSVVSDDVTEKKTCRVSKDSDGKSGKWIFENADNGLFSVIYVTTSENTIHFDGERGLVTQMNSQSTQDYGSKSKGTSTFELKSTTTKDEKWIELLTHEVARYSRIMQEFADERKSERPLEERYEGFARALSEAKEKSELPFVLSQIDQQLTQLEQSKKYALQDKEREALVLDKPAADWSTKDIDGGAHSMEGYKGKVVVMDFWYRGCGWCIKAMPQIKEVVEHYRGRNVVILGMNTDRDEQDARFVVDKLALNYATLKATGLPEKFAVRGFPTLVIVDQHGIVRKRHVGYSPTLREDLIETIDHLLKSSD